MSPVSKRQVLNVAVGVLIYLLIGLLVVGLMRNDTYVKSLAGYIVPFLIVAALWFLNKKLYAGRVASRNARFIGVLLVILIVLELASLGIHAFSASGP
ncbi:MAG: hypothetical protein KJ626_05345 [Verrucomicrobia bacterium]|nr:hypothetical protein [Verrucomicrobiota bacterium]